jgi:hypothetical protein
MKYVISIFVTAVIVFLGAFIYFKGIPTFPSYNKAPVSTESATVSETATPTPLTVATTSSPSATQIADQNISIVSAVQDGLVAEHGPDAANMTLTISKVEGNYAKGMANGTGGGGLWFAAKVGAIWKLVWDGNGIITCADISAYPAFPADLIPQCWDAVANKLVTR